MLPSSRLPTSSINAWYRSRLESKCWYRTGLVTPTASAMSFIEAPWNPAPAKTWSATSRICSRRAGAESRWDMCYPMVTVGRPVGPSLPALRQPFLLAAVFDVVALGRFHGVPEDDRRREQGTSDHERHDDQRGHRCVEVE